jgi:hypothetical protein
MCIEVQVHVVRAGKIGHLPCHKMRDWSLPAAGINFSLVLGDSGQHPLRQLDTLYIAISTSARFLTP